MASSRLSLAVEQGAFAALQAGPIAVFRPRTDLDLSALSGFDTVLITGFLPDFEYFKSQGSNVHPEAAGNYVAAVVCLPRSKSQAKDLIALAMAATDGGPVIVDGQKTDGVDSILKACRGIAASVTGVISKSHGKVFTLEGGDFDAWKAGDASKNADGFWTVPGVFSADGVDPGSRALAAALPKDLSGKVADLGAGWGYLSQHILQSPKVRECHLVEAEHLALDCARKNLADDRAKFHWADAPQFEADDPFDHVVTNPPFHTGRAADHELGRGFIAAAKRLLRPAGTLWLVANRHLPYERALSASFGAVEQIQTPAGYKVFKATNTGSKAQKSVSRRRR